jgi:Heterokaryon incompatibility protein (HET)
MRCIAFHPGCSIPNHEPTVLPIRLLEIDIASHSPLKSIRLRCDACATSYLTLSHCWGVDGEMALRLLQANLEDFIHEILIADLSKTFRDAVSFAQGVGIRYLWIDSLCIIQESEDDWLYQSSLIGDIYSRSLLNLASTVSRNGNEGLFRPRKPSAINHPYIEPKMARSAA